MSRGVAYGPPQCLAQWSMGSKRLGTTALDKIPYLHEGEMCAAALVCVHIASKYCWDDDACEGSGFVCN